MPAAFHRVEVRVSFEMHASTNEALRRNVCQWSSGLRLQGDLLTASWPLLRPTFVQRVCLFNRFLSMHLQGLPTKVRYPRGPDENLEPLLQSKSTVKSVGSAHAEGHRANQRVVTSDAAS